MHGRKSIFVECREIIPSVGQQENIRRPAVDAKLRITNDVMKFRCNGSTHGELAITQNTIKYRMLQQTHRSIYP